MEMSQSVTSPEALARRYWRFGPHNIRVGFRNWRRSRPFWGGLWAILGGAICAAGPASAVKLLIASGSTVWMGVLIGVLISIFGLFLWFAPAQRHLMGVLIACLSVVSLITSDFGGFLIGMLLGMTGGALGFAWVPAPPKVRKHRVRRLILRQGRAPEPAPARVIEVSGAVVERVPAPAPPVTPSVEITGERGDRTPATPAEAGPMDGGQPGAGD